MAMACGAERRGRRPPISSGPSRKLARPTMRPTPYPQRSSRSAGRRIQQRWSYLSAAKAARWRSGQSGSSPDDNARVAVPVRWNPQARMSGWHPPGAAVRIAGSPDFWRPPAPHPDERRSGNSRMEPTPLRAGTTDHEVYQISAAPLLRHHFQSLSIIRERTFDLPVPFPGRDGFSCPARSAPGSHRHHRSWLCGHPTCVAVP